MAQDEKKGKKFWEDDEDEDDIPSVKAKPSPNAITNVNDTAQIDQKIHDAKVLMDQTHQLYQQYFNRVEKRPPVEKVKLLEGKVNELQRINTTITTSRFKLSQFLSQYGQMKDLWERKLRELERK